MSDLADPRRIIGNLIQIGTIERVDRGAATCRVRVGDTVTGDICWVVQRAGGTRMWSAPTVGEQCLLLCPEGDSDNALAVLGIFSDAFPPPSADEIDLIAFDDGAVLSYDARTHALAARLPAGGTVAIEAPGGITVTGPVRITGAVSITGDLDLTGTATAATDMVAGGKSLKTHIHSRVQPGGGVSGPPQ